jgi:DNA-binding CsgD family transcriptional regulator
MELMQGHLRQVQKIAAEGIKRLEGNGRKTPFSATLYGELSQVHYQWHELDEFRKNSTLSIQASGKSGYSDPEIYHAIMLSKIAQMEDDWISADKELQKAIDLAGMIPPAMVRENLISQQVRVLLAFDRIKDVENILKQEGFSFDETFSHPVLEPDSNITHPIGLLFTCAVRVLLFLGKYNQDRKQLIRGIDLASILLKGELHCNHIPIVIETLLIRSQLFGELGEEENCLVDLLQALEYGKPERFLSVFIEEGKPVAESLMLLLEQNQSGKIYTAYIQAMLDLFPGAFIKKEVFKKQLASHTNDVINEMTEVAPLVEALTKREMEVLQLIVAGDSNQEIAGKLVITVSAVKKHISNILGKLGVKSRTQAIASARLHKLITT